MAEPLQDELPGMDSTGEASASSTPVFLVLNSGFSAVFPATRRSRFAISWRFSLDFANVMPKPADGEAEGWAAAGGARGAVFATGAGGVDGESGMSWTTMLSSGIFALIDRLICSKPHRLEKLLIGLEIPLRIDIILRIETASDCFLALSVFHGLDLA